MAEIRDCHYCEYSMCANENDERVVCCVDDFEYFDHYVKDSKEAEECEDFVYCDVFPKN